MVRRARPSAGKLYFIPSSTPEADRVFDRSAEIGPQAMLQVLHDVVAAAVERYRCDCAVIDCGPIIDPYTAAGAMLADREFLIGQNEPISYANLHVYPDRIREWFPAFSTAKMKLIINKWRSAAMLDQHRQHEDIFAAIPFTMDIVDISEGLEAGNEMQVLLFEHHIHEIVRKIFQADHPELIPPPDVLLPPRWESLVRHADRLEQSPRIRRLGLLRLLLPLGLLGVLVGAFLFYDGATARHRAQNSARAAAMADRLKVAIAEGLAAGDNRAGQLQKALAQVEAADPHDDHGLDAAADLARAAGLTDLPAVRRLPAGQENAGIGVLAGGAALGILGLACAVRRGGYLKALRGIRKEGTRWLMAEMSARRSTRKTVDRLLKMADSL
jgi:hypothetical protein